MYKDREPEPKTKCTQHKKGNDTHVLIKMRVHVPCITSFFIHNSHTDTKGRAGAEAGVKETKRKKENYKSTNAIIALLSLF